MKLRLSDRLRIKEASRNKIKGFLYVTEDMKGKVRFGGATLRMLETKLVSLEIAANTTFIRHALIPTNTISESLDKMQEIFKASSKKDEWFEFDFDTAIKLACDIERFDYTPYEDDLETPVDCEKVDQMFKILADLTNAEYNETDRLEDKFTHIVNAIVEQKDKFDNAMSELKKIEATYKASKKRIDW